MTTNNYKNLLFTELRLVSANIDKAPLSEEGLVKAMTLNENLKSLGYTLSPKDIVLLSKSNNMEQVYEDVNSFVDKVKSLPMYPNFPREVMEMTEAQRRFHQLLHYMSTYGVESMFGTEVSKGWLPNPDADVNSRTEADTTLLAAKVLQLIPAEDAYIVPFRKILSKRERMTEKEREIIKVAVENLDPKSLSSISVPFKENLLDIFYSVMSNDAVKDKVSILHSICQHTGDVWKCLECLMKRRHFKIPTSMRKTAVRLLESYDIHDFEGNIILSLKKRENIILLLNHLSYNKYSKSAEHKAVVAALRNGELRSWYSKLQELLAYKGTDALSFLAKRPGEMLRRVSLLVKLGYEPAKVEETLSAVADKLSLQTLISILNFFGDKKESDRYPDKEIKEATEVFNICKGVIASKLATLETPMKGKKVYLACENYNLALSRIETNDKSDEGGYVRSGLAYRLPKDVERIRFFVYWNDPSRVDVDLHLGGIRQNGESIHVGWNADYVTDDLAFSGDITHSDAAEYIDIDLSKTDVKQVWSSIKVYSGPTFKNMQTCFAGILAVDKLGEDVALYNPKNCFFSHDLKSNVKMLDYGYLDVENRCLVIKAKPGDSLYTRKSLMEAPAYSLRAYLDTLLTAQGAEVVTDPDEAEVTLVMEKPNSEKEISILDANFFFESGKAL